MSSQEDICSSFSVAQHLWLVGACQGDVSEISPGSNSVLGSRTRFWEEVYLLTEGQMTVTSCCWIKQQTLLPVVSSLQCKLHQRFQLPSTSVMEKKWHLLDYEQTVFCELVVWTVLPVTCFIALKKKKKNFICFLISAASSSCFAHQCAKHIWRQNLLYLCEKIPVSKVCLCQILIWTLSCMAL